MTTPTSYLSRCKHPEIRRAKQREYSRLWAERNPERAREIRRKYHQANKEQRRMKARERRAQLRIFVNAAKDKPCMDCGQKFPSFVMQFDHVRGKKGFGIGQQYGHHSTDKLLEEVAKCDIVCANCHAIRTWGRK